MGTIVEHGFDWCTFTAKRHDELEDRMLDIAAQLSFALQCEEHSIEDERRLGYDGYRVSSTFWGTRQDGSMLQSSGGEAVATMRKMKEWNYEGHVTRLDVQITVNLSNVRQCYTLDAEREVLAWREALPGAIQPAVVLIDSHGRGNTLNIGSRSSQVFARIYDKGRKEPQQYQPGTYRFEVEYKRDAARRLYEEYLRDAEPHLFPARLADTFFRSRGIDVPWGGLGGLVEIKARRPQSDNQKRLKWLREGVRPAIIALQAAGLEKEAIAALGLHLS